MFKFFIKIFLLKILIKIYLLKKIQTGSISEYKYFPDIPGFQLKSIKFFKKLFNFWSVETSVVGFDLFHQNKKGNVANYTFTECFQPYFSHLKNTIFILSFILKENFNWNLHRMIQNSEKNMFTTEFSVKFQKLYNYDFSNCTSFAFDDYKMKYVVFN